MIYGLDYLGGANYGDLIVREHPEGFAAGFMLNTNAPYWPKRDAWPVIKALEATGRCPTFRVHAMWEDGHQYQPAKHDPIIFAELERASDHSDKYQKKLYFSPFCEMDTRGPSVTELFKRLEREKHSNIVLVNSVAKGASISGIITEVHGEHAKPSGPCIYSFDGDQCYDANIQAVKRQYSNAEIVFLWSSHDNGKWNDKGPNEEGADTTPRPLRRAWPYEKLQDSKIYLHRDPGDVKLGPEHIWKSHADQHQPKPNTRDGKPVLITPRKGKRCELVADNGQVVAVMPWTDTYKDGRAMYRLAEFGFIVAEKARRIQGHGVVKLRIDGKVIGRVNPAFRAGSFR